MFRNIYYIQEHTYIYPHPWEVLHSSEPVFLKSWRISAFSKLSPPQGDPVISFLVLTQFLWQSKLMILLLLGSVSPPVWPESTWLIQRKKTKMYCLYQANKSTRHSFWLRVSRTCPDGRMRLTCAVWFQELVWMPRTTCGWPRCTGLSPPGVRWVIILLNLAPPVSRKGKMLSAELGILTGEQKALMPNL